ncbi:MAG: molybdopterin-dependent oxidoreductase [Actinobacteria bacterium]|nr:molybdopterin-dependent oxidoreductase [Actinomycetota bacterium]
MAAVRSICCHCESRCGVLVELDDEGRPAAVTGDPSHPISRGFLCPRGRAAVDYYEDPRRLRVPLRRRGARGEGRWEEISWEAALDEVAAKLLAISEESGPEAVAYLNGTLFAGDGWFGNRLLHKLGSPNCGGAGLMCGGPQFAAGALTFGFASAFPEVVPGLTETVVVWGQHPAASAPMYWALIRQAQRAGAKLVVVDSRPTIESRHADLWLQPRPGTDAALALALVNLVIDEGLVDEDFVGRWARGLDELAARASEYPPERAAELTGVPAARIREAAALYAGRRPAALSSGTPNGQGRNALNLERSLQILIALTGNFERPGGNHLFGPLPEVGSEVTHDAFGEVPPEQRRKRLGADRFRLHGEGVELLSEAATRVWFGIEYPITRRSLGIAHPPSIFEAISSGDPYQVRALLLSHHNAVGAYSGSAAAVRALTDPKLELLVVHDLRLNPTSMLADIVLPAASWMEKPFMWSSGWGNLVATGHRVVAPAGERRSDYEFCRDLGRRLGQEWPDRVEDVYDEWLRPSGRSFAELLDSEQPWLPGTDQRRRHEQLDPSGEPLGFGTPSGQVELSSTVLAQLGYDPLPSYEPRTSQPEPDFPLYLMTGGTRIDATHQDHRQVPSLRARHPDPQLEIDPDLAAAHDIAAGDWVEIETEHGSIRQRATFTPDLGTDRVSAERWWYPERDGPTPSLFGYPEANVNAVTSCNLDACDPAYGALPYRIASCRIRREPDQG